MLIAGGVTGAVVRSIQLVVMLRLAGVGYPEMITPYRDFFLLSIPGLAVIIGALWIGDSEWITTGSLVLGGILYYALIIWKEQLFKNI